MADNNTNDWEPVDDWQEVNDWEPVQMGGEQVGAAPAEEQSLGVGDVALGTLGATAKGLDVGRATTGGLLVGALIEMLSGKKVFNAEDVGNAVNPANLKTFPTTSEMLGRAGVPEGAQLSDLIDVYGGPDSPWYQPEKGGALDPSVRGSIGTLLDMASDPLTYATWGSSAAAKQAVAKSATSQALKGAPSEASRIANALSKMGVESSVAQDLAKTVNLPVEGAKKMGAAMQSSAPGRYVLAASSLPSKGIKKAGEFFYNLPMQAVEHEGMKFGKEGVGDVFYQGGVKTPFNLEEKAGNLTDKLMNARNKILMDARKGEVDTSKVLRPAYNHVETLIRSEDEATRALGLKAKKRLDAMVRSGGAKDADYVLDSLPRSMEMGGGHSPIEFAPQVEEILSLPRQGTMAGGKTAVDFIPEEEILDSLPRGGDWKYGPTDSQRIFSQKPEVPTMYTKPGQVLPGETVDDVFTQLTEVPYVDVQPGRVVPGKPVKDDFISMPEVPIVSMGERKAGWTPKQASKAKSRTAARLSEKDWADDVIRNEAKKIDDITATSLRRGTEEAVAKELGAEAGANLKELNQNAGKMLSTKKSQAKVSRQADRDAGQALNPTSGTNRLATAALGPKATAINMALRGLGLMTMPGGYAARKFAESPTLSSSLDAYLRTKYKQSNSTPNPWSGVKPSEAEEK